MIGETIKLISVSGGGWDDNGDPLPETEVITEVQALAVAPGASEEHKELARNGITIELTVYLPSGTTVTEDDIVEVRGVRYEIEGRPVEWVSPFGAGPGGYEILCRLAQG
ncbi:hypothetical protein ACPCXD_16730 [Rhodococcus sp. AB351]|uniref:hypothetical protein n=1 Tax=Rhodococcus sp. AB351 TaxID=3413280 RepID=UPI003C239A22